MHLWTPRMEALLAALRDWRRKEEAYLRYERVWRWLTTVDPQAVLDTTRRTRYSTDVSLNNKE